MKNAFLGAILLGLGALVYSFLKNKKKKQPPEAKIEVVTPKKDTTRLFSYDKMVEEYTCEN